MNKIYCLCIVMAVFECTLKNEGVSDDASLVDPVKPVLITERTPKDTDDPAIWVNPEDFTKSLIIGTDKDVDGGLYVFDLEGKIIDSLSIKGLKRPNNVDVGYGLPFDGEKKDFAVTTERLTHRLRFYSLPQMQPIDGGEGIEVFEGETGMEYRDLMGIAVYHSPHSGKHYAIVGRKNGPRDGTYLWQYEIKADQGQIELELVRKFGMYSGRKEIEAIAVDNELGYVYYSDETFGVRKYHAEPERGNEELAVFATEGFARDHEGISIYKREDSTGFILVSDQQANQFHVFPREGTDGDPHHHPLIKTVKVSTESSDGSEITHLPMGSRFPKGLFVAMSEGRVFHYYGVEDILDGIE